VESGESDEMINSNTMQVAPKAPTPDPYYSYYEQPSQPQQASFDGEEPTANIYATEYSGVSESLPSGMVPVDPSFYVPFGSSLPSSAYVYHNQVQ
jgi:hypothetical protein